MPPSAVAARCGCVVFAVWGKPRQHEVVTARLRPPVIKGARVRPTRCLPAGDIDIIDGVPTLALPRLLAELSCELDDLDLVAVLDDLLARADQQVRAEVHARAGQLSRGRRGPRRLAELTVPGAAARFRSWLERTRASSWQRQGCRRPSGTWSCTTATGM